MTRRRELVTTDPASDTALSWYFPHRVVYGMARYRDRHAGTRPGKPGRYLKLLARIEAGDRRDDDIAGFTSLLGQVWVLLCLLSVVPALLDIVVTVAVGGFGGYLWLFALLVSLLPGVVSFAFVFYLHGIAMSQFLEDPDGSTFIVEKFLIPRRINLTVMVFFTLLGFVLIGAGSQWFRP